MAQSKSHTHTSKVKLNPKAEEALAINFAMRNEASQVEQQFKQVYKPSRRVKVRFGKDKYNEGMVETKVCKRTCTKCPLRFKCFTERDPEFDESEWKGADATKGTGKTLLEWKSSILREMPFVDIKPYSHNIISIALGAIGRGWGYDKANQVVDEYGLVALGWHKEKKDKVVAK